MLQTRARDNVCYVAFVQRGRRAGRAGLRRALGRARRRGRGARARARVRGGAARGRRRARGGGRAAPARRAPAVARERAGGRPRAAGRARRLPATACGDRMSGTVAPLLDDLESMRLGARARPPRLRRQERLPGDRRERVRRDRLGADGGDRLRGARPGARALRVDAVAVQLGRRREATRVCSPSVWGPTSSSCRSSRSSRASSRRWPSRSAAASRTSPRRTSRRASAACC